MHKILSPVSALILSLVVGCAAEGPGPRGTGKAPNQVVAERGPNARDAVEGGHPVTRPHPSPTPDTRSALRGRAPNERPAARPSPAGGDDGRRYF